MQKFPGYIATLFPNNSNLEEYFFRLKGLSEFEGLAKFLAQARFQGVLKLTLKNILIMDTNNHLVGIAQKAAQRLVETLQTHTLLPIDYSLLQKAVNANELLAQIEEIHALYIREFKYVIEILNRTAGNDIVVIKGLSIASYYPEPSVRDNWDIDLFVEDFHVAMDIAHEMILSGSKFDDMSIKQVGKTGYGWKLHIFTPNGIPVEFHVGPLQAYSGGILDAEFLHRRRYVLVDDISFPVPSAEDQLLYLLAHAYRDGFIKQKDINDAYILTKDTDFDTVYFQIHLEKNFLKPVCLEVLEKVGKAYPESQASDLIIKLRPNLSDKIVGSLFGLNSTKSSNSFQLLSFPAHSFYLISHHKKYGIRRGVLDIIRRIKFGLEHQIFPEKDARRDLLSPWLSDLHDLLFSSFVSFHATSFDTAYFQLIFPITWKSLGLSWAEVYEKLPLKIINGGTIRSFANHLCFKGNNEHLFLITPLGIMIPFTYYKMVKGNQNQMEINAQELLNSILKYLESEDGVSYGG